MLGFDEFIADDKVRVEVERLAPAFRPPPRGIGTSAVLLTAATFRINATYDRVDDGFGQSEIAQGVLIVVPKQ